MAAPVLFRSTELLVIRPTLVDGQPRADALTAGAAALRAPWAGDTPAARRATGALLTATTTYTWVAETRDALADLLAFFDRRAGRLNGCWLPSFRPDVTVLASDGNAHTIRACDYTARVAPVFTALGAQDAIGIWAPDDSYFVRSITAATDNGDGTETLTLGIVGVGSGSPLTAAAGGLAGFVRFARLAEDRVTIAYRRGAVAVVTASFLTLPRETP